MVFGDVVALGQRHQLERIRGCKDSEGVCLVCEAVVESDIDPFPQVILSSPQARTETFPRQLLVGTGVGSLRAAETERRDSLRILGRRVASVDCSSLRWCEVL